MCLWCDNFAQRLDFGQYLLRHVPPRRPALPQVSPARGAPALAPVELAVDAEPVVVGARVDLAVRELLVADCALEIPSEGFYHFLLALQLLFFAHPGAARLVLRPEPILQLFLVAAVDDRLEGLVEIPTLIARLEIVMDQLLIYGHQV